MAAQYAKSLQATQRMLRATWASEPSLRLQASFWRKSRGLRGRRLVGPFFGEKVGEAACQRNCKMI